MNPMLTQPDIFVHHVDYTNAVVYKIFLKRKHGPLLVSVSQAVEIVRQVAALTAGMPQVVYLVGWQHDGHDSSYPDWTIVNPLLTKDDDTTPLESLRWLIRHCRDAFGARVSLHVNLDDAYETSPLWQTYLDNGLLIRDEHGRPEAGGWWDGERAYHINKTAEWRSGHLARRLDWLVDNLPLAECAGTLHIDTFRPHPAPAQGVTYDDDLKTCIEVARYLHDRGLDLTSEFVGDYALAGPIAWAWAYNFDELGRLRFPRSTVAGGHDGWNQRVRTLREGIPMWAGGSFVPAAGTLYARAWGITAAQDLIAVEGADTFKTPAQFEPDFYANNVPCHFLDRHRPIEHRLTRDVYEVRSEGDVVSRIDLASNNHTISQRDRLLLAHEDYLLPAPWAGDRCFIAYCGSGLPRRWSLDTGDCVRAAAHVLNSRGDGDDEQWAIAAGSLEVPGRVKTAWLVMLQ